jgi:hypothetical protein
MEEILLIASKSKIAMAMLRRKTVDRSPNSPKTAKRWLEGHFETGRPHGVASLAGGGIILSL